MKKNKDVIIVGLSGGLGNQLFQYAAGRALALKLGYSLELDLSWFSGRKDREYALDVFSIFAEKRVGLDFLPEKIQHLASRISRRFLKKRMGVNIFREPYFHFHPAFNEIYTPVFLEGYWQSEKYFNRFDSDIRKDLNFKDAPPHKCQSILEHISTTDSICLHIRRGDYISDLAASQTYESCSLSYYQEGVSQLITSLNNPHCYIFSDDCEWVKKNIRLHTPYTVVDINSTKEAHWDLLLMSSCEHFIIANSSLSWWGAWLGTSNNKRVIAPKKWFIHDDKDTKDLTPVDWEIL